MAQDWTTLSAASTAALQKIKPVYLKELASLVKPPRGCEDVVLAVAVILDEGWAREWDCVYKATGAAPKVETGAVDAKAKADAVLPVSPDERVKDLKLEIVGSPLRRGHNEGHAGHELGSLGKTALASAADAPLPPTWQGHCTKFVHSLRGDPGQQGLSKRLLEWSPDGEGVDKERLKGAILPKLELIMKRQHRVVEEHEDPAEDYFTEAVMKRKSLAATGLVLWVNAVHAYAKGLP